MYHVLRSWAKPQKRGRGFKDHALSVQSVRFVFCPGVSESFGTTCVSDWNSVKGLFMNLPRRTLLEGILAFVVGAAFLFVVLYPYTPTPIATSIGKILVGVILTFTSFAHALLTVPPDSVYPKAEFPARFPSDTLLDLICVRLR
jgi:hypothetical protein